MSRSKISTRLQLKFRGADGTLDDFIIARETEGQALKVLIEQRPEGVTAEVVSKSAPICRKSCNGSVSVW